MCTLILLFFEFSNTLIKEIQQQQKSEFQIIVLMFINILKNFYYIQLFLKKYLNLNMPINKNFNSN